MDKTLMYGSGIGLVGSSSSTSVNKLSAVVNNTFDQTLPFEVPDSYTSETSVNFHTVD